MFDGNHRSRRTVDLSGRSSRRRATHSSTSTSTTRNRSAATSSLRTSVVAGVDGNSRQALLETARLQREERRELQRRDNAARTIQRYLRGWNTRRAVSTAITSGTSPSISNKVSMALLLSVRLSPPLLPFLKRSDGGVVKALLDYYHQQQQSNTVPSLYQPSSLSHARILLAALHELRPSVSKPKRQQLQPTDDQTVNELFALVQMLFHGQLVPPFIPMQVLSELVTCCQEWIYSQEKEASPTTQHLWKWSCKLALAVSSQDGFALLAGIIFCAKPKLFLEPTAMYYMQVLQEVDPSSDNSSTNSNKNHWYETCLLPALVQVLAMSTTKQQQQQQIIHRNISRMVDGRECILLNNALDLWNLAPKPAQYLSFALIELIQVVFQRRPDLAFLTSLVVGGKDNPSTSLPAAEASTADSDDDDDDDGDDDPMDTTETATTSKSRSKRHKKTYKRFAASSTNYTRQELQTVPKLDRLYQEHIFRMRKDMQKYVDKQKDRRALVELSKQIGNPLLWAELAKALFITTPLPPTTAAAAAANGVAFESLNSYVTLLYTLLQCSTGLRTAPAETGVQSEFMSKLAFQPGLLEELWKYALALDEKQATLALKTMTVFSDLFAYHLLAVNDEEFLVQYTPFLNHTTTSSNGASGATYATIVAEDVVGHLRSLLYGWYWIRPVVVTDMGIPTGQETNDQSVGQHRARLLLAGTKLWNSLYERWCRLLRHRPFTDESTWWFPHLMTRDDGGAVNATQNDDDGGSLESMDVDNDSDDDEDSEDEHEGSAAEQENDALAESFKDPKMARILTCVPQALPFDRRVKLFSSLLTMDKTRAQDENADFRSMIAQMARGEQDGDFVDGTGRVRVQINRNEIYSNSLESLNKLGSRLKKKVQVTFVNQHGALEPGIDGGGVFKEFLDDLIKEAFYPDKEHGSEVPQLFSVTPLQTLSVNSALFVSNPNILQHYEFLGRVLGKAVYESILVEPQFCLPFLNKLLGKQNTLDDLKNFDAEYYKNVLKLRKMNETEIEQMGLTFELTTAGATQGSTRNVELIPGGSSISVNKQNVHLYVHLVAHQRLNVEGGMETRAFLRGFRDLIPASWVRLFSAYELQKLISGDDAVQGIDVGGLKAVMQYAAGYHPSQPIIRYFWEVIEEMTPEQQRKFLKFMTSCSRQPLLGFQSLNPAPCVQQLRLPDSMFTPERIKDISKVANLPTSSTCMNLLKLPNYREKQLLKRKLLDAIESGAGFELT